MSRPTRVYVDFDDVLCETALGLAALLEAEFGKRVAYHEIRWFDLGRSFDLTPEELARFFSVAHLPENLDGLQPVSGAREVLEEWRARGCEILIVTGRPPETAPASRAWLARHRVPYDRLLFADKYDRLAPGPDILPLESLAGLDLALAIDDAPVMLEYLLKATSVPVFVFDRPWNAGFAASGENPDGRVLRCGSWAEIGSRAEATFDGRA